MLKTDKYKGLELTKQNILSLVREEDIFRYYIGFDFIPGRLFLSPLRDESNPSFCVYYNNWNQLRYKDFAHSQGSCFDYVMNLYNLSFFSSLKKINQDLNLGLYDNTYNINNTINPKIIRYEQFNPQKQNALLQAEIQKPNDKDINYWLDRGVFEDVLVAKTVFLNKQPVWYYTQNNPIFVYYFPETNHIKCYRPFEKDKKRKWISNCSLEDVFGWNEFIQHENVNNLVVTKSGKDRLILKHLNYISIAPQAEGNSFPDEYIKIIKNKADNIWINMDNDEQGIKATMKYCEMFNTDLIFNSHKKDIDESYLDNKELLIKQLKIIE